MLQAWRKAQVMIWAGYILGFPTDTPESIKRDIEIIKRELPIDILEFFCLTPLPGSEDHKNLYMKGIAMDPDMNKYDLEHVCTAHPIMSKATWEKVYRDAWDQYYADAHVETILRRAFVNGLHMSRDRQCPDRVLRIELDRRRASAAVRHDPPQGADAASPRHADRQPPDLLSVACRTIWSRVRSSGAHLVHRYRRIRKADQSDPQAHAYVDQSLRPVEGANRVDEFVQVYADRIPNTYGAPVRAAVAAGERLDPC